MNSSEWKDFGIKVRKSGSKAWAFLTPRGGTSRLKVHAARFTSNEASNLLVTLPSENPGYEFKKSVLALLLTLLLPLAAHAEPDKAPCVVNVQTCTVISCAFLPGIGQAKGAAIAQAHPKNEAELDSVKGIGPATLEALRPFVVYQGETTCTSKQSAPEGKDGAK